MHGGEPLFQCLSLLFSLCLSHSVFPDQLKLAHIIPLFKGSGDPSLPSSYRPISLTSHVSKVFERILLRHLSPFISKLSSFQAGFFKGRSLLFQLLRVRNAMLQTLSSSSSKPFAFLDFAKAFDTVWTQGLLFKLHSFSIPTSLIKFLSAFLTDRYIKVTHDGYISSALRICSGVPQGCVLSPTLFNFFIDDIVHCCFNSEIGLYADDVCLWPMEGGAHGIKLLNLDLARLLQWSTTWGLYFNVDKCKYFICQTKQSEALPLRTALPAVVLSIPLKQVRTFKYLGLHFNANGDWDTHISGLKSSCSFLSMLICRLADSHTLKPIIILQIIKACLLPRLTYGWPIWQPRVNSDWHLLENLLLYPLRRILSLPSTSSRERLLLECGFPPLRDIASNLSISFFRKIQLDSSNLYITSFFSASHLPSRSAWYKRSSYFLLKSLLEANDQMILTPHTDVSDLPHVKGTLHPFIRFCPTSVVKTAVRFLLKSFYIVLGAPTANSRSLHCSLCDSVCLERLPRHLSESCSVLATARNVLLADLTSIDVRFFSHDLLIGRQFSQIAPHAIKPACAAISKFLESLQIAFIS
ncbi:MAG: reverse transcriptase family protein [Bdellovibrio sp.]